MRAIGYFVDWPKGAPHAVPIAEQNRAFLDFCAREGFEVEATFFDEVREDDRLPGLQQMLDYLGRARRGFTVVVVHSARLLGRDLGKAATRLLAIEASGVRVLSVATGGDAAKELVDAWAERGEGTPASERIRAAMRRKAVKGEVLGRPPYGYRVGPRRRLEIVPDEAVVVRYIFRLYLHEGMGIRRIAGQLNQEGIRTRRGGKWSMVSVRDILRNRVYLGTYSRFGGRVPGSHPALISPEDFRRVQERLERRGVGARERSVQPFLLSGLVYCAKCGNRMIGVSRRQRWRTKSGEERQATYRYYQCETRTNQSACEYNTQRAQELEEAVREAITSPDEPSTRVRVAGSSEAYAADLEAQIERLEGRRKRIQRQLEETVADAAHGHLSLERMRRLGSGLAEEYRRLEAEIAALRDRLRYQEREAARRRRLSELRELVAREWETMSFEERQEALRELIDRVEVDGADIRVFFRP